MMAREVPEGEDGDIDEYEGEDAIEAICLYGAQQVSRGYYYDLDDTMSVE